jgi:O-antigen ligase
MAEKAPEPFTRSRWFALIDLALAVLAGALWYNWPTLGWIPVLLPLAPWMIRVVTGVPPFQRTQLDAYLLLFTLTALMGVWAAYDRTAAWSKFWLVLDGIFLYFALAGQPRQNRWLVAGGFGFFAVALAGYFFLTNNWRSQPANFAFLNRLGYAWMRIRPTLPTHVLHPNVVSGLMAMTGPFLPALSLHGLKSRQPWLSVVSALGGLLVGLALLMATSRGAWLGLAAAVLLWGLWQASQYLGQKRGVSPFRLFLFIMGVSLLIGLALVLLIPDRLVALLDRMPGPANAGSRLDLIQALLLLIRDFPFTGGGLDAFAGLYSQYILISPSLVLVHGHNLYLDVTLEQGLLGGIMLAVIIGKSLWQILVEIRVRPRRSHDLQGFLWAALAGLIVMAVHGSMDDVLYGSRAPMLLWILPGAGFSVMTTARLHSPESRTVFSRRFIPAGLAAGVLLILALYGFAYRGPLLAAWRANMAAVEMARIELAFFPTDKWDDGAQVDQLKPAADEFERALLANSRDRTAHHRLGQIAMLNRDFDLAVSHLEAARREDPSHPGIRKLLAYNYLWTGRFTDAYNLMLAIPEARYEMGNYVWWWRGLGRADLSEKAALMLDALPGQ